MSSKRRFLVTLSVVLILALVTSAAILQFTHKVDFFHHKAAKVTTGGQYTKGLQPNSATSSKKTSSTPQSSTSTTTPSQPSDVKNQDSSVSSLVAPSGTFANTYKAQTGDQMTSTCNTTPGATCQIIFTNGSITKSLPVRTTDKGGAAYWAWKPSSDIGLTPGTWHIKATAVLGSETKTTNNDPLTLEIL